MTDQQRTRLLAGGLIATVVVFFGRDKVDEWFIRPLDEAHADLKSAQEDAELKELQVYSQRRDLNELLDREGRSLPPDEYDAQRAYQQWLTDLGTHNNFGRLAVSPLNRRRGESVYTSILVRIEAQTTLQDLARFLDRFYRADVLHRINDLSMEADDHVGNPILAISMTAEGLSMPKARDRQTVFPRTISKTELTDSDTLLEVTDAEGFPDEPGFLVRLDGEYMLVTSMDETTWTVERGADGSKAATHTADVVVEAFFVHPDNTNTLDDYRELLAASPFVTPKPPIDYTPKLNPIGETTLVRGKPLGVRVTTSGFDPSYGEPQFALDEGAPGGMQIDEGGNVSWEPEDNVEVGEYKATVLVTQPNNDALKLSEELTVTLREPNEIPVIETPDEHTAYLGHDLKFTVAVKDDSESWKFSLEDAPSNASIDAESGEFTLSSSRSDEPGELSITVVVEDSGKPAQKATKSVKIRKTDDAAEFTYLIGAIAADDRWEAWLFDRSKQRDQRLIVRQGEQIAIANIQATVTEIHRRHIILDDGNGKWKLRLGDNLRMMTELPGDKPVDSAVQPESDDGGEPPVIRAPYEPGAEGDNETVPKPDPADDREPPGSSADAPAEESSQEQDPS